MKIKVNEITKVLDDYLNKLNNGELSFANILFVGNSGIGKYSSVEKWIKDNKDTINPYPLDYLVVFDGDYDSYLNSMLNRLNRENSVSYFHLIGRGKYDYYQSIIKDRIAFDSNGDQRKLDNLKLFIATDYPLDCPSNWKTSQEFRELFDVYEVETTKEIFKEWIDDVYKDVEIRERREHELMNRILSSDKFEFIWSDKVCISPVTLLRAVQLSGGIRDEFMKYLSGSVSYGVRNKEVQELFEEILED